MIQSKAGMGSADAVTLALKNGNSETGKLSGNIAYYDAIVAGWSGEIEQGFVFLPSKSIRAIEFEESSTTK